MPIESSSIIEYFKDKNEREFITKMLFETVSETSIEEIVFDCLKILKSEPIKQQISDIRVKIREKESCALKRIRFRVYIHSFFCHSFKKARSSI